MRQSYGQLHATIFLLAVTAFASPPPGSTATIDLADLSLAGIAELTNGRLRLTPAKTQKMGAAWLPKPQPVVRGFEVKFSFQLTEQGGLGNGADGMAFVLQNGGPDAIGGRGSSGGFALGDGQHDLRRPGIPNSIAVFFDTYRNHDGLDPSDNYVAICTNGAVGKMRWPPSRLAVAGKLKTRLKDGQIHEARIVYRPPVLSVYLDGGSSPIVRTSVDLATVASPEGTAFAGFTASTGNGFENHDILSWSFSGVQPEVSSDISLVSSKISFVLSACLEGRNLCTPESPTIENTGTNRFHVVLPAHLEWGASVPNASGAQPVIINPHGNVCWDLKTSGADGCSGPGGAGVAGSGFLDPGKKRGAIVTRTRDGKTQFSINDRAGAFNDNEGYFEFDVDLR